MKLDAVQVLFNGESLTGAKLAEGKLAVLCH